VVPANYNLPSNVAHTILSDLHLPEGAAALLIEELAESMALGANYSSTNFFEGGSNITTITREDVIDSNGVHPTYSHSFSDCISPDFQSLCPGEDNPTPPPPPPVLVCGLTALTATNPGHPGGRIRVLDTQLGICEPVSDVKIRTKNWFKIRNTRTHTDGTFLVGTQYKNRVKINVIFRNDEVSVRPLRNKVGIRLSLFPITYTVGVYTSWHTMNTVDKVFERPNNRLSKGFEAWLACNAINSRKEQIAFAESPAEGLKAMKDFRLNVYLSKHGVELYKGPDAELILANYLIRTRGPVDWIIEAAKLVKYIAKQNWVQAGFQIVTNVLQTQRPDVIYNYNTVINTENGYNNLSSNNVNQAFYAVYTKAGMLKATNNSMESRWKAYFKRKAKIFDIFSGALGVGLDAELIKILKDKPTIWGIDNFATSVATIIQATQLQIAAIDQDFIDIVEGFGEYYGHIMCDAYKQYGTLSSPVFNNKFELISPSSISSHARVLEDWQPNVGVDLQRQERFGLFNDLHDNNSNPVEIIRPFNQPLFDRQDLVNGVTRSAMFNAITGQAVAGSLVWSAPQTWLQYRDNINSLYSGQLPQLSNLYTAYLFP
jgi:hypothetical protein